MTWQPIDTAPKGYHDLIIACRAGQRDSVGPVRWRNGRWQMPDGEHWKGGWLTHWMPLPEPPEQSR